MGYEGGGGPLRGCCPRATPAGCHPPKTAAQAEAETDTPPSGGWGPGPERDTGMIPAVDPAVPVSSLLRRQDATDVDGLDARVPSLVRWGRLSVAGLGRGEAVMTVDVPLTDDG